MPSTKNWTAVTETKYAWERDALDFVRTRYPTHEPYRAWANFEFIADDGSINEVDLLLFTPQGFFLVEIKSRPGRLFGDAGTWTWEADGKLVTVDNPLIAANLKAKKLGSLLDRQKAFNKKGRPPFIETLVFCSAPDLVCDLRGNARLRVCVRDRDQEGDKPAQPGILAAVMRRECPGLDFTLKGTHDRPMAKLVSQAMEQAGIRASQRHRKVSDYVLEQLIGEGPGYQDWQAAHAQVPESKRRVRLYLVRTGATADERNTLERAARREYLIQEALQHPGVLRAYGFTEHELGPALIFEHDPKSVRLDHYLAQQQDKLSIDTRLDLVRQIAEVIRYAHDKKVIHRGLSPQSVLVTQGDNDRPRIKIYNWQVGSREGSSSAGVSRAVTATRHVDRLVEDISTAYMAPEALLEDSTGEHLDIFSLGAIAYHIFSGVAPAANGYELSNRLRETKGLQISAVLNGAADTLQYLVQYSTHPEVTPRTDTVADFLSQLDDVEAELTTPEHEYVENPAEAKTGDLLPGGYRVQRRLGQGACSVALLVEREGQDYVLKVASSPEHNDRLKDEADVLRKLVRHPHIIQFMDVVQMGDRCGFLMMPVFAEKDKKLIDTLAIRLVKEGGLHIDMLQRFGDDLLGVVNHLEEQGIPHRDIKPENIAVGMVGRGDRLHLVLFDFSLSRTPVDNIRAGTSGYLDPLLPLRKPPRWDLYAERYAAAVTLYEVATGRRPQWGDGATDPSHLSADTEITIEPELFDPSLREPLAGFFRKAFRREIKQRFHNAEQMLEAWRDCFKEIGEPGTTSDHADERQFRELLDAATFDTSIAELGLGTRATNALDRANILTVEDLLTVSMRRLLRLRGVGNTTRREISAAVKALRDRLGTPSRETTTSTTEQSDVAVSATDAATLGIDLLAERVLQVGVREGETAQKALGMLLGLDSSVEDAWPSQADVAKLLEVSRARIGQILGKFQSRWGKDEAVKQFRTDLIDIVAGQGGVVTLPELVEAAILARGSADEEPHRSLRARAVVRATLEVDRLLGDPPLLVQRGGACILVARDGALADYARRLGEMADQLADEDPLAAPARVIERLREISPPAEVNLSDVRLTRLAVVVSRHAALSSRQEFYPRGMPAVLALKLSHGALGGLKMLSAEQVRERVAGRYPEAAPLPDRPALDDLLEEAGFDLRWEAGVDVGTGSYQSPQRDLMSVTTGTTPPARYPTVSDQPQAGDVTPEEADARQFEERLQRAIREGAFLNLLVDPKRYEFARESLCRRFEMLQVVDLEGLFLDALQAVAGSARVNWDLVLKTDATPHAGDWDKLMLLVGRAMKTVEQRLLSADRTMLVIYPGVLARYDQMDLLGRLSQKVGRRDGIPGLWLLLPGDNQALIDGKAVPLLGPGQRARIPESWLDNRHRSAHPLPKLP